MNICHIITRLIVGGAQENTLLTCLGLHERGHNVSLLVGPEAGPEGTLIDQARAVGYQVHVVPSLRRAIHPVRDLRSRRHLRRLIERLCPDIVHTHSSKAGIVGRLAARDVGVPLILHTIHGLSFNRTQPKPVQRLYRRLEAYCARYTDKLISVADAMTAQSVASRIAPPEKFVTIYSGMRTDWFDPARFSSAHQASGEGLTREAIRRSWGFSDHDVVAGTIARLFRNKGYEQLIPAMAAAARQCPELRFVWVGDGAQRGEYEQQLDKEGLLGRVKLLGLISPQDVPAALAGMDMLVHASQWEGLPRAVVQALLMEVPVISFAIDGAPEVVIPGKTGVLVPLNDVSALSDAMTVLACDLPARRRFGAAGRQLCLERFDWRRMVDQIEQLYLSLLADSPQGSCVRDSG